MGSSFDGMFRLGKSDSLFSLCSYRSRVYACLFFRGQLKPFSAFKAFLCDPFLSVHECGRESCPCGCTCCSCGVLYAARLPTPEIACRCDLIAFQTALPTSCLPVPGSKISLLTNAFLWSSSVLRSPFLIWPPAFAPRRLPCLAEGNGTKYKLSVGLWLQLQQPLPLKTSLLSQRNKKNSLKLFLQLIKEAF